MRNRPAVTTVTTVPAVTTGSADTNADRPVNRAERRAAARGRDLPAGAGAPSAPRTSGPRSSGVQPRPAFTRPDFAARKSG